MVTVSLRFDEETKRQLDEMCDEMGMNLTTFFTIYAKKALRDRRIPFDIAASPVPAPPVPAPKLSDFHERLPQKPIPPVKAGQIIIKTSGGLEVMESE